MPGSRRRSLLLRRVCRRGLRRGVLIRVISLGGWGGGEESGDLGMEKIRCVGRVFSKKFGS